MQPNGARAAPERTSFIIDAARVAFWAVHSFRNNIPPDCRSRVKSVEEIIVRQWRTPFVNVQLCKPFLIRLCY